MQEVFNHCPVIGSDECVNGIERARAIKETFDECHEGQHDIRRIAVNGTQFNIIAQPYPQKHRCQMELPVRACGIGASRAIGKLEAPLQEIPGSISPCSVVRSHTPKRATPSVTTVP